MRDLFSKLKGRPVLFYINLATAFLAIVSAIVFAIVDNADANTFSVAVVVLMGCGGIAQIVSLFLPMPFMPFAPLALYSAAVGVHIDTILVSLSDLWTGVGLYNGNNEIALVFLVLFAVCAIQAVVNCFMNKDSEKEEVKVYENIAE